MPATGGGTWQTFDSKGTPTGSGTLEGHRTSGVGVAPGLFDTIVFIDNIDSAANSGARVAVLRIVFSDGSHGVLTVHCSLVNTPPSVFEGITVSKGFVDYGIVPSASIPPGRSRRNAILASSHEDD